MGLWEFLRQWRRGRMVAGVTASLFVHLLVAWAVLWGLPGDLAPRWVPRKGDTIIVELPRPEEPAQAGSPAAPPPPPAARPAPPAPPAPRPAPPPPRQAPAPPPKERRVASAPRPVEPPPTPRAPEPAPRAPEPAPRAPEPVPSAAEPAAPAPAVESPARPTPAPAEVRREPERQVASVPPGPPRTPSVSDVRAALRQGAGGRGGGRGGIEGDPIPLDSPDVRYSEYLEQIRRRIKEKWGFPCVRNAATRECDHHSTSLDVQFGIRRDGRVEFVEVVRPADYTIYDEYAVNAIKLASPFPPVPAAIMATLRPGSTGMPLSVRFSYVVESSLTNLLR